MFPVYALSWGTGAHINTSVTLGASLSGYVSWMRLASFLVAQVSTATACNACNGCMDAQTSAAACMHGCTGCMDAQGVQGA